MDLKANIELTGWLSGKKHVDRRVVFALGLFGLLLMVGAAWLALADWRHAMVDHDGMLDTLLNPPEGEEDR